jgi:hypothetical protein
MKFIDKVVLKLKEERVVIFIEKIKILESIKRFKEEYFWEGDI